jgi:hypothetical protein
MALEAFQLSACFGLILCARLTPGATKISTVNGR